MRHDDSAINSILQADPLLNELQNDWFVSLMEFFHAWEHNPSAESLNGPARNVMNRQSEYNMAAAQTSSMLEQAFDYMRHGQTCWRECCVTEYLNLEKATLVFDPLGVMGTDISF
ncbi:hypothetical protein [Cryobacterium sp. M96]|uniref:hypothetical protein n=1 Tax=Cryobacterium sp. M96 TaxID=2048295 RepID=UPI000CE30A64|nr:hypothetical protein [Cryobacterium sp. M96]